MKCSGTPPFRFSTNTRIKLTVRLYRRKVHIFAHKLAWLIRKTNTFLCPESQTLISIIVNSPRGYSINFHTGRLSLDVQLIWGNVLPFYTSFLTEKVLFSYIGHSIHLLNEGFRHFKKGLHTRVKHGKKDCSLIKIKLVTLFCIFIFVFHGRSVLYANTHARTWEIDKIFFKGFLSVDVTWLCTCIVQIFSCLSPCYSASSFNTRKHNSLSSGM